MQITLLKKRNCLPCSKTSIVLNRLVDDPALEIPVAVVERYIEDMSSDERMEIEARLGEIYAVPVLFNDSFEPVPLSALRNIDALNTYIKSLCM